MRRIGGAFAEMFMTAPSPGIVATTMLNAYYDSHEDYLDALAREMRNEYQAIHEAGLILQIDAPDLAMERTMMFQDRSDARFRQDRASCTSPRSTRASRAFRATACGCMSAGATGKARTSTTCRSATILPVLYQANVGALSIEFANPRHAA